MSESPFRAPLAPQLSEDEALARDALAGAIEPGEQLVWAGRPVQGLRLVPGDLVAIPFSLLWGGFVIFWEVEVVTRGAGLLFSLWGIPFVTMGLYIIAGRFFVDARRRARTFYGLTGARALILVRGSTNTLTVLDLAGQKQVEVIEGPRGRGSIRFGPVTAAQTAFFGPTGWPGANKKAPSMFESVPDVREVYAHVREAQRTL